MAPVNEALLSQYLFVLFGISKERLNLEKILNQCIKWYINDEKQNISNDYHKAFDGEEEKAQINQNFQKII